jgi:hypothetical protein
MTRKMKPAERLYVAAENHQGISRQAVEIPVRMNVKQAI